MSTAGVMQPTRPLADVDRTEGRIGPNAILQVFTVLEEKAGAGKRDAIARYAGLSRYLLKTPSSMVAENEVVQLHKAVRQALPTTQADDVLREAGSRTALYILEHRIPKIVKSVLKRMPARIAGRALLHAIARHAWTFAGSGTFRFEGGYPARIELADCPACFQVYGPGEECVYYTATMEGLFRALAHPNACVLEQLRPDSDGRTRHFRLVWQA